MSFITDKTHWRGMIRKLWGRLAPERTEKVTHALEGSNIIIEQQTAPCTPLNPPVTPLSPPLTPQSPDIHETCSESGITTPQDGAGTNDNGGNTELRKELSITRQIREWRKSRH
jgi:hypothetical protein